MEKLSQNFPVIKDVGINFPFPSIDKSPKITIELFSFGATEKVERQQKKNGKFSTERKVPKWSLAPTWCK